MQVGSGRWLALMIGNSRLHWAEFEGEQLRQTWDEPHPATEKELDSHVYEKFGDELPLWIASVVPAQSKRWATYPKARFLSLEDVPLPGMYPTLGIDRALAVWGAIAQFGCPVLVIDAGTALTFTGADAHQRLVGGAILPGLRLQFQALHRGTAALPAVALPDPLPPRWSLDTESAIASGILYTAIAGIQSFIDAWWQQFPGSAIVLTGGDSAYLYPHLTHPDPADQKRLILEQAIIFRGMQQIKTTPVARISE